nr:hypothetical protein [Tanacetum cinerariifolium]
GRYQVTNVPEFNEEDFSSLKDRFLIYLDDIKEDQRSSSELLANLNVEFHKRSLLANQRRFYKRSGRLEGLMFGCPVHIHNHKDHLGNFDENANDGFFLRYSPMAKAFRMSTEGDAIYFNENRSFPNDEFQEPKKKIPQGSYNNKYLSYVLTYDPLSSNNINISKNHTSTDCAQNSVSPEEQLEPSNADDSLIEPKRPTEALEKEGWIIAMQEELNQLKINKVWTLVPLLNGFRQEEGIDYDETFAPVARLKAIRIFLEYAAYMGFTVYQIDMKSAFLNDKILKEVYVQQPPGFESSEFPNHVCKLDKALYGLKQAPRAWYETLSKFLIQHKFVRGPDESRVSVNEIMFRVMISCISKALTIQLSAMYAKYLKEFWYTAKVENNITTFSLSYVEKPLSFNHDLFSSVIGLDYAKKFESLPSYEDVKEGLPTLGLTDEKMIAYALCRDLKIDITCILFNDLATKLSAGGKKGREKNICYVRYMSIIMEHLLKKYYLNDDLKLMKSHQMTDARFKNSKIPEVPLTSHMQRISQLLEKPLNPFSKEVNIEASSDMSLSRTSEHSVSKPKAKTDKKRRTKKNPSSSKPNISKDVVQTSHTQSSKSQPADEIEVPADINQSLEVSKSAEDQNNQPQTADAEKSEERYADKLTEELADMNASAEKPSLSDPLSHLCNEVSNLTTKEKNNLESPKSAADVDNAQEEQKSDDIARVQEEQHSDNKSKDPNENQKSAAEKVNTDSALIIHPLEEKPLEDEPPSKKPMFKVPKEILSPTPLNSIRPQFITSIIINMPQNQDSSILSKPADKGKAIAAKEYPTKELIPLLEESGSSLKNSKLKLFSSDRGQMTIKKAKAQIEELRKIKLLKAEKEKSNKELLKKLNHVKDQTLKLAEYEAKSYTISKRTKEVTLRITRDNDPTTLTVYEKFRLKMLGLTDRIEVHALASKGLVIIQPEAGFFYYNGNFDLVFQREHEFHLASTTQLIKQLKHIKRDTLEAQQMVKKLQFAIEARDDVDEARKIIRHNLDDGSI